MKRNGFQVIVVLVFALLVLAGLLARSIMYTVDERELAVILQFGQPVASRTEPGLYFKLPFVQEVRRLPKTLQYWQAVEEIVDLPTADGKKIEVSAWAIWRITDPGKFVQVLRTVDNAENAVRVRVRAAIRDVITSYDLAEVVRSSDRTLTYSFQSQLLDSDELPVPQEPEELQQAAQPGAIRTIQIGREKIMRQIFNKVEEQLRAEGEDAQGARKIDRGINLVDVGISNIGFVPAVREAAFERLKAFMESIASRYFNAGVQRKQEILNQTKAEVEKILGEGEERSNVIRGQVDAQIIDKYAQAIRETGDFYTFIRTLEVYEKSFGGQTRLILTTDSDLFRLLKDTARPAGPPPAVETPATAEAAPDAAGDGAPEE